MHKRYPCGGLLHSGIDAALALRDQLGPHVAEIAEAHVGVTKYATKRAWLGYPETVEEAKFNMNYLVAYALTRGAPGIPGMPGSTPAPAPSPGPSNKPK